MTWKQCVSPLPGDYAGIQDPFAQTFLALQAPKDMALFVRDDPNSESLIFLMSPNASRLAPHLLRTGCWVDCTDVSDHGWSLLVGNGDPWATLGVPKPDVLRD